MYLNKKYKRVSNAYWYIGGNPGVWLKLELKWLNIDNSSLCPLLAHL